MGNKHICLPFASEAQYREYVDHPAQYRQYLREMLRQYPALFPHEMDQGFPLHDAYASCKQDVIVRRIKLNTTGAVFSLRPSFVMPYMIGRTEAVEKALYLRQWGVPCDALAYVFGRDAMFWYRAWLAFGRPSLVGTTIKEPQTLPRDLVADEKLTRVATHQVSVATTVGGGCFLGGSVVEAADTVTVERGYGACAKEAKALAPDSQARSVCPDGWAATRQAGRGLLPKIKLVLCFLHSLLKMKKHCAGQWRHQGLDKAWQVSQAATTRQFAQRLRRVAEWTPAHRSGPVAQMVLKRCRRRADFTPAYECPQAHRTSNAVDRLLDDQDRLLYARRYWHGTTDSARLAVRAMARQWHVYPYGVRLRRDQPSRVSPFHDLNGLQSPPNWLQNLLIASSMGGLRHGPQIPLAPGNSYTLTLKDCIRRHNGKDLPASAMLKRGEVKVLGTASLVRFVENGRLVAEVAWKGAMEARREPGNLLQTLEDALREIGPLLAALSADARLASR